MAQWLEDLAAGAMQDLQKAGTPSKVEQRRLATDVAMQAGLGRFFAARFRSGVLYAIHEKSGDRRALEESIKLYRDGAGFVGASVRSGERRVPGRPFGQ